MDDEADEAPAADLYKAEPTEAPVEGGEAAPEVSTPPEKRFNK
jgi:hypothetical protein